MSLPPNLPKVCPYCKSSDLYTRRVSSAGIHGPYLLDGLGGFMHFADLHVVLCATCGLTQFFAEPSACQNVKEHADWMHL